MPRIDTENNKPIRKAMSVLCGIERPTEATAEATASNSYDNINGSVTGIPIYTKYMDLSQGGFLNDGTASPLDSNHAGIISNINAQGTSTLNLTLRYLNAGSESVAYAFYYDGTTLIKQQLDISTTSLVINGTEGRIQLVKIAVGPSWWFNNESLISCSVALRAVETRVDNPELQISDIEIIGYEPDDVLDRIALIGDNMPVYYTSGYPGDMAPIRKFYLSEPITWADKQLRLRAEDATKFLEDQYSGKYVGNSDDSGLGGGVSNYADTLHEMLNNSGIEHEYVNDLVDSSYSDGEPFFLPSNSKRSLLAQCVNLFRFMAHSGPCYINYTDAGRPTFKALTGKGRPVCRIKDYADLLIDTDRKIKRIEMDIPYADVGTSQNIETIQTAGTTIKEITDPYYSVATSKGSISLITPYKYKLTAEGDCTITGRPIRKYDPTDNESYTPCVVETIDGVDTVTLEEFWGMEDGASPEPGYVSSFWHALFYTLLARGVKKYSFTWRGDPRLQPRDYITLDVNGVDVDMTIESITLDHSDGGLTSQIVAREGLI